MSRLSIDSELRKAELALGALRTKTSRVVSRAINKTLGNVQTEAVRTVRLTRALQVAVVKKSFSIKSSTDNSLAGSISVTGRPVPLRDYAARQSARKGVTVLVTPGKRTPVSVGGKKAFIIDKIGGNVFVRSSKSRLPIVKLFGPSIPSAVMKGAVLVALYKVGRESFVKRLQEETRYVMRA